MPDFGALPCGRIVFRGAIYKDWIKKDKTIQWQAFKLREDDIDGVSLSMVPDKFEGLNNPVEGVISVHPGRIRDIGQDEHKLDVIQDAELHALLTGLPYYFAEDAQLKIALFDEMKNLCIEIAEKTAREFIQR